MGAIYYRQMVELGKTHKQAMGVVMSHLASRVYTVLKEDRPLRWYPKTRQLAKRESSS